MNMLDKLNSIEGDKYKFGELVNNHSSYVKNPLENGLKYAFGLANFEPNNLSPISSIDIEKEGTNFTRYFEKGQLLFGARRAYLKQMVIAPFNGVCTANIMVFDTKNDSVLKRVYLYLICQSNAFIDYASGTSVGSLFPNAKWKYLKNFEFTLPPINEQEELIELYHIIDIQITDLKAQEKNLRKLKSKFLSLMFSK